MNNLVLVRSQIPDIEEELRYSTKNNVCGKRISSYEEAVLPQKVLSHLMFAADNFRNDGYRIKIWDTLRTKETQNKLRHVNSNSHFVSPNSNHIKGKAIDMTLVDSGEKEIDTGTDFDEFSIRAGIQAKDLTKEQAHYRKYLQRIMAKEGFRQSPYEWWHFDFMGDL